MSVMNSSAYSMAEVTSDKADTTAREDVFAHSAPAPSGRMTSRSAG
jgi:hypothetical protein